MANKLRRIFRRSEYLGALDNYRKARRRGDAADAQRWIKVADMHLRVANRFDEGVHRSMARESEIAKARTASVQAHEQEDRFAQRRKLDEIERQMIADVTAEWVAEQRAQAISPAEGSASAGETR